MVIHELLYRALFLKGLYMDYAVILNELKNNLSLEHPRNIGQENLDKLIDYAIKNCSKEIVWRIALSYSDFDLDFTKIVLYFIKEKDSFYIAETISAVDCNKINIKLVKEKFLERNDKDFIKKVVDNIKTYCDVDSNKELKSIIEDNYSN